MGQSDESSATRNAEENVIRWNLLAASLLCGTATFTSEGTAETVRIRASKDNTLYESETGALSSGAGPSFFVGRTNQAAASIRRGLVAFDVARHVPRGSRINSVTLTLLMSRTLADATDIQLHRVTADWGEGASNAGAVGGSGAPAAPGDATWIHRLSPNQEWTTPGGDYAVVASATANVIGKGPYFWGSTSEMIADVQGWLDDPDSNFGWLIRGDEREQQTAKRFDSRENDVEGNRPLLTVEFAPPEPSAVPVASWWGCVLLAGLLGGLGLIAMVRRRAAEGQGGVAAER